MYLNVHPATKEVKAAIGAISAYDGKARLRIEVAIEKSVKEMARLAKSRVPVRSGTLKKSIFHSFKKATVTGQFGAKSSYAHLVEFGVRPVTVRPKERKALRIIDTSVIRFAQKAHLPARPGRPFIRPSYIQEMPNLINDLKRAVQPR